MKIKFTLIYLFLNFIFTAKAQNYVTIPDPFFVSILQGDYPACMTGNQMDTTCPGILNETGMFVSGWGISDLTGLEYFDNLQMLNCSQNALTSLPRLSNSVFSIDCSENMLTSLPPLPSSLTQLNCYNNQLTNLPQLPDSLRVLFAFNNQLLALPTLPTALENLYVSYNQLTNLPSLPASLVNVRVGNNLLTGLPPLPTGMYGGLWVNNNQLTSLPELPPMLSLLFCDSNNIHCFPVFPVFLSDPYQFSLLGNPFTCLPNYVSGMASGYLAYPLCSFGDSLNNSNNCVSAEGIVGNTFKDNNSNCLLGLADQGLKNIPMKLINSLGVQLSASYSLENGIYNFCRTAGTYTVSIDTIGMPFMSLCLYPGIDSTIILSTSDSLASDVNFDINCKPGFDIGIQSVVPSGWVFPGQEHRLNVTAGDKSQWYNLNCAAGIGGQVQITVNGPVTYSGIVPGALTPSVLGNVYTYAITDFGLINNAQDFGLSLITDNTANTGDLICVSIVVTPYVGDFDTTNNFYDFCYQVVNSYDPNMKEVYPVNVTPGYQDWLTYTIHFQNTGSAPAMNIRLTDVLNNNLDLENLQIINYSHPNTILLNGNVLTVRFPNIQLPDSLSDAEGSKGFIQYRIKPKPARPAGTQILNKAYIYFDYNPAIVTNTTTNLFVQPLSITEKGERSLLSVYPNPGSGIFNLKTSGQISSGGVVEVYNSIGILILQKSLTEDMSLDITGQSNGIYMVKISGPEFSFSQSIIKQ